MERQLALTRVFPYKVNCNAKFQMQSLYTQKETVSQKNIPSIPKKISEQVQFEPKSIINEVTDLN